MKLLFVLVIGFISFTINAQDFTKKEIKKLKYFQIDLHQIDFSKPENKLNLELMLKKDRLRRVNKNWAIYFVTASVIGIAAGTKLMADSKDSKEAMGQGVGVLFATSGVICGGISIPLFIASKKRKKERNELIKLF